MRFIILALLAVICVASTLCEGPNNPHVHDENCTHGHKHEGHQHSQDEVYSADDGQKQDHQAQETKAFQDMMNVELTKEEIERCKAYTAQTLYEMLQNPDKEVSKQFWPCISHLEKETFEEVLKIMDEEHGDKKEPTEEDIEEHSDL